MTAALKENFDQKKIQNRKKMGMTLRYKLLLSDMKEALESWYRNNRVRIVVVLIALATCAYAVIGMLLILRPSLTKDNQVGLDKWLATYAPYWWIPVILYAIALVMIIPYKKIKYKSEYWYVRYLMPISKAPLYINDERREIRNFAKKVLEEKV